MYLTGLINIYQPVKLLFYFLVRACLQQSSSYADYTNVHTCRKPRAV